MRKMRKRTIVGIAGASLIGLGTLLFNPVHKYLDRKEIENGVLNADFGTSTVVRDDNLEQKRGLLGLLEDVHGRIVDDSVREKLIAMRVELRDIGSADLGLIQQLNEREKIARELGIPVSLSRYLRNGFVDSAIINLSQELYGNKGEGFNISDYGIPDNNKLPYLSTDITPKKIKSDVESTTPQGVAPKANPERRAVEQPTKVDWKYNPSYAFAYEGADGRYDSFTLNKGNTIFGGLEEIANRANARLERGDILRLSEDVEVYRKGKKLSTWSPNRLLVGDKVRLTEEVQDAIYGISEECTTENIDTTDSDRLKEEIRLFKEELDARKRAAELIDHNGDNLLPINPRNALSFNLIVPDYKLGIGYERLLDNGIGLGVSFAKFNEGPAVLGRASYGNDRVRLGAYAGDTFTGHETGHKLAVTAAPYVQFDIGDKLYLDGSVGINDIGRWKKQLDGNGFDGTEKYGFLSLGIGKKF